MNEDYVQNLRYKLQKRVRRLNSVDTQLFQASLKQFWVFLDSQPTLKAITESLVVACPTAEADATTIVDKQKALLGSTETEGAAIGYCVLKKCVESKDTSQAVRIAACYRARPGEGLDTFREVFLEPFYDYLDEHLDDGRALLALLRKYKYRCEWFHRKRLYDLWEADTIRGEKTLVQDLYEYLFDNGVEFYIEPSSASGKADMVSAQTGDEPLIADGKIFNPDRSKDKGYIARGFGQVYQYTLDFNEPFGYLIIFKTSEHDLRFALTNSTQSTPFVVYNNKTIFLITIDLFPHVNSASKRGVLAPVEITEGDLIKVTQSREETPT